MITANPFFLLQMMQKNKLQKIYNLKNYIFGYLELKTRIYDIQSYDIIEAEI